MSSSTSALPGTDWARALFEAIDDAVFVHDLAGNILEANAAASRRLGYARAELLRLTTRDIDDPTFAVGFQDRLDSQLHRGHFRFEGRHRTKDGQLIDVDINSSVIDFGGKSAILAVMRDITQRKQVEGTLAQQTILLQSVLNSMADAVIVSDRELRILLMNTAAQRAFNMPPLEECIGKIAEPSLFQVELIPPLALEDLPLARSIRGEHYEGELLVRNVTDGKVRWMSVTGRPMCNEHGAIQGGIVVCRDISQRRRNFQRQAVQYEVVQILASEDRLEEAAAQVLRVLCQALGFAQGALWVFNARERLLQCLNSWHVPDLQAPEFLAMTRRISFPPGLGLPGQVLARNAPQFVDNAQANRALYPRAVSAGREGLQGAYGFPIQSAGECIGVLEFFSRAFVPPDEALHNMMRALGSQIGQVLERRRVEKALRDSEALYQSLVESLPQNIFRKDRQGRVIFGNDRYCKTLKVPRAELLGKTDFDLFPPELAGKYVRDDQLVMDTGQVLETVEAHHLPNNSTIYVQVVKTPVHDAQGNVIGTQGIFWDVTEKKLAEEAVADSERRYRQLTEATLDGIVVADAEEKIVLFNPAAEKMFGYQSAEAVGQPVSILIPAEFQAAHAQGFQRYKETRQSRIIGQTLELQGRRKDGSLFPVEIALSVIRMGGPGEHLHFLGALRDVTERNKMRSILVHNEKLASIGLLSAGVAHEINNPLAFVANNLVVLERDCQALLSLLSLVDAARPQMAPELAEKTRALADDMDLDYIRQNLPRLVSRTREGVDRVTRIVQSLRGLARTDAPRRQDLSLGPLIAGSLEILAGRLKKAGITVEQEHDPELRISGVTTQLSQVLLNLLVNAVQALETAKPAAGKPAGAIRISTRRQGPDLLLEIADNGPGIDPANLPRIFDPFFTTKEVGEGTGLGLSISHNIIAAHGGRIEVDSQPGQGACFRIYLPLASTRT